MATRLVKFVINSDGIKELLKSDGVYQACAQKASEIADRANSMCDGFETEKVSYPERNGAIVRTGSAKAYYANMCENILEKSKGF